LRKGGVTGEGECGAIVGGRLVLGYFLGDPDPAGPLRPELLEAMVYYEDVWKERTEPGQALMQGDTADIRCNTLVGHLADDFWGEERMGYCTHLAAQIAASVAETLEEFGSAFEIPALPQPEKDSTLD
jgi:hypothetical protein